MERLSEKEWVFLNEITHMIHDTQNLDEMRSNLLELLAILIPNSCASFYLGNEAGDKLLADPVAINIESRDIANYLDYGEKLDYTIPIFKTARPIVYKETDLFDNSVRQKTEFYNEFLAHGLEYPLALCIAKEGRCYGALSLYRSKKMGDFCDRDVFILGQLHNHLLTKISLENYKGRHPANIRIEEMRRQYLLTAREMEVICDLVAGRSYQEIADSLCIEVGTVKKHIHNVYTKFNVKNRLQLLQYFL